MGELERRAACGYIAFVRASILSRLGSATLLFLVALSAPGAALAHGWAHHEQHEHYSARVVTGDAAEPHRVREASEPDHEHEHTDAQVGEASRPRAETEISAPVHPNDRTIARVRLVAHHAPRAMSLVPPGDPHTGPPPRVRAPPSC